MSENVVAESIDSKLAESYKPRPDLFNAPARAVRGRPCGERVFSELRAAIERVRRQGK